MEGCSYPSLQVQLLECGALEFVDAVADVLHRYKTHVRQIWSRTQAPQGETCSTNESTATEDAVSIEKLKKGVASLLSDPDLGCIFIAYAPDGSESDSDAKHDQRMGRRPVAVAVIHKEVSDWRAGFVWYINALAVDPSHPFVLEGGGIGLPPDSEGSVDVSSSSAGPVASEKDAVSVRAHFSSASHATLCLVNGIRAAVCEDSTANGLRVMIEDPLDIMRRPFYDAFGQYKDVRSEDPCATAKAHALLRTDSSAYNSKLLCKAVGSPSPIRASTKQAIIPTSGESRRFGCSDASLEREHYFMMTWYRRGVVV